MTELAQDAGGWELGSREGQDVTSSVTGWRQRCLKSVITL